MYTYALDHQKADVAAQKKEVARVKALVKKAHITVKADEHCPPELEAAEADLVRLEGIPNHVPADIESECKVQTTYIYIYIYIYLSLYNHI